MNGGIASDLSAPVHEMVSSNGAIKWCPSGTFEMVPIRFFEVVPIRCFEVVSIRCVLRGAQQVV